MEPHPDNDIAIIGMSCRVAGANTPSELWNVLAESQDVRSRITRFSADGFYHPEGGQRKGLTNVQHAYTIHDGIDRFDNGFFAITPVEASAMDPQQRLLLEVTYEAIESAGLRLDDISGTATAVYAGIFTTDYHTSLLRDVDATPKYQATGTANSIAANRISYTFNLTGHSVSLDTACSSTMVALHMAVKTIQNGEAPMAIVCGANLILNPDMFVHMSELGFLSPRGRCHSFDASGDGYVRGEGCLALLLKPLKQAIRDNDPIRAVIKGTRLNQDGRTQGITLPSSAAQRANMAALYDDHAINPADIQYVEAHGTGTAAGDPIEMSALDSIFGSSHTENPLVVGSIKSNIGHLESCAALAGIIKTVEALERGKIPPQMHFKNPNPKIDFSRMKIPTTLLDWPVSTSQVRRAAVNSFGFGGTNGHAVFENYPREHSPAVEESRPFLFIISAENETSLNQLCSSYADYIEANQPSLRDLSLVERLRADRSTPKPLTRNPEKFEGLAFVFTGQGAQWVQMGKDLCERSSLFRSILEECDRILQTLPDGPDWSIIEELQKPKATSRVYISTFSQPLCTALQLGLVELWRSWGITPSAVVGHSSGEIGAAYAAGILSLRDAIVTAFYRGLFLSSSAQVNNENIGPKGAMCAIGLSQEKANKIVQKYKGKISLAAINSPTSCTLSGDQDAIDAVAKICAEDGTFCRALRVDMAYHSHHMIPLSSRYVEALVAAGIQPQQGRTDCRMFSSVTGRELDFSECTPSYWKDNMVSTVRFAPAVATLFERMPAVNAMLELGPHPALKGPVGDILGDLKRNDMLYFESCSRGKPDFETLLESSGQMIVNGLPLGWLRDMREKGTLDLPFTCYLLMAYEAARQLQSSISQQYPILKFEDLTLEKPFSLSSFKDDDHAIEFHLNTQYLSELEYSFEISSEGLNDWGRHFKGRFRFSDSTTESKTRHGIVSNIKNPLVDDATDIGILNSGTMDNFEDLVVTSEGATGRFPSTSSVWKTHPADPILLDAILTTPKISLLGHDIPLIHDLIRIASIEFGPSDSSTRNNFFEMSVSQVSSNKCSSFIEITTSGCTIHLAQMEWEARGLAHHKPALNSLFFQPEYELDITRLASSKSMSLQRCLKLITHKWPMVDMGIDIPQHLHQKIVEYVDLSPTHRRPRCRSLQIVGDSPIQPSRHVYKAQELNASIQLGFLMTSTWTSKHLTQLAAHGFVCLRIADDLERAMISEELEVICSIEVGDNDSDWVLCRYRSESTSNEGRPEVVIISEKIAEYANLASSLKATKTIDIHSDLSEIISMNSVDKVDVIIVDTTNKSILAAWSGDKLLPLLQSTLRNAQNLLWVSKRSESNPHTALAGGLLKTFKNEQPDIRVSHLVLEDISNPSIIQQIVRKEYERLRNGDCETEILVDKIGTRIPRFHADDNMSTTMGLLPAKLATNLPGSYVHQARLIRAKELSLVSQVPTPLSRSEGTLLIAVDSSLLDIRDSMILNGRLESLQGLGQFFEGRILDQEPSERVLGWHLGAHQSVITVPSDHVILTPNGLESASAAALLGSFMVGICILNYIARVRKNDRILLNTESPLIQSVFGELARSYGIILCDDPKSDFVIDVDPIKGCLVNGRIGHVQDLLEQSASTILQEAGAHMMSSTVTSQLLRIPISEIQVTSGKLLSRPALSTVLTHSTSSSPSESVLIRSLNQRLLFDKNSTYIILGGLGGLGLHVSSWMVGNGARHIVCVSRSGSGSSDSKKQISEINQIYGPDTITIAKADGCDRQAMENLLNSLRQEVPLRPIRGVINMAMVLGDAPMLSMTKKQWDQAVQVKILSSWILHELTVQDGLDFFIMFSSISSLIGNRAQGNYVIGNTFQNSLAAYRHSQGLPAVAIALGVMTGVGVIEGKDDILRTLKQTGLSQLEGQHLDCIMEAAILPYVQQNLPLLSTGFEMFEKTNNQIKAKEWQTQLFWAEYPDFGFLLSHSLDLAGSKDVNISLLEQLQSQDGPIAHANLLTAFSKTLASMLGYEVSAIDPTSALAAYGLDSLSAVTCRYWFFKETSVDVPVFDILGCKSLNALITRVLEKLKATGTVATANATIIRSPKHYTDLEIRPLSHSQRRLWFLQNFLEDKTVYNLLLVCHITGTVNVENFAKAWSLLVKRHEVLHSKIHNTTNGLQQTPVANPTFNLTVVEWDDIKADDKIAYVTDLAKNHVFNLEQGELVRGWLFKAPDKWRFFLSSHHLAWDRASSATIFDETSKIYQALSSGTEIDLEPVPYQFVDYTLWQETWLADETTIKPHVEYWEDNLKGIPDAVSLLPNARRSNRPSVKQNQVDKIHFSLGPDVTSEIKEFCRLKAVTPFMFLTSALATLVHRLTNDTDVVIGIADGDRGHPAFDRLVGFTVNMLAIRCKFSADYTYDDVLENIRESCLGAYEHRAVPLDFLLQRLNIKRNTSHNPVFQIVVNYLVEGVFPEVDYGSFKFDEYDHYNAKTQCDLALEVEETEAGSLDCSFEFDSALYDVAGMKEFMHVFETTVVNVMADSSSPLKDFPLVSQSDKLAIRQFLQPEIDLGSILGIIKAGATYTPIDPDYPEDRMNSMIEDTNLTKILVDRKLDLRMQNLLSCGIQVSNVIEISSLTDEETSEPILSRPLRNDDYKLETTSDDILLLASAMVFDMSLPAIFGMLLLGSSVAVASREVRYSPPLMVDFVVDHKISSCIFTPTQLKAMLSADNASRLRSWQSLKSLVAGGEAVTGHLLASLIALDLPMARYFNGYGPTETTICNSLMELDSDDITKARIPLGGPLQPSRFYILDQNLHETPIGFPGELYIGGLTVNDGYINRPETTARTFTRDMFCTESETKTGWGRLYKTGDSFRLLSNGNLEFCGRIGSDRQVKIRGMRTELEEIENAIWSVIRSDGDEILSLELSQVAVVFYSDSDQLVAYLTSTSAEISSDTMAFLRLGLRSRLPIHMIPSIFKLLETMPLSTSGKTDYKTLAAMDPPRQETPILNDWGQLESSLPPVQKIIATIWRDVLSLNQSLQSTDNFFEVGGHSLVLISVQNGIKSKLRISVSLGDMFAQPTLGGMEELVLSHPDYKGDFEVISSPSKRPDHIDWEVEASLPNDINWEGFAAHSLETSIIALTGACSMAGVHFLHHLLVNTDCKIFCIAVPGHNDAAAMQNILDALENWKLYDSLPSQALLRISVYAGSCADATLGLDPAKITILTKLVDTIYHIDSEVSLLKNYQDIRAANLGSVHFLIKLAQGGKTKRLHYLSTWGVPHLQSWNTTQLKGEIHKDEQDMGNMVPGPDSTLGYLKCRWACEAVLLKAAEHGLPVTIYRSCMCGGSRKTGQPVGRTDINRRILEASLQVGMVPDFSSENGGGMSWVSVDFLVESIYLLSQLPTTTTAKIYHVVNSQHNLYNNIPKILQTSYAGDEMRSVDPAQWFSALRKQNDTDMTMMAEVLARWHTAGWVPFGLEAKKTLEILKLNGLTPPVFDLDFVRKTVIGKPGFS
ncbi:Hybrid PKS-NRPS synthetase pynA [Drechslerella dactyloides]|uniref:Hybrid PKS-NRPS synthetase pynA n=1 Tax=Drechslerella dactyloides TaxID=74499 RepID=A0AAD6J4X2_DREDA|nr:Hybrid PKS-NRPS synthetase pynA [Drechslerella dactyloides]